MYFRFLGWRHIFISLVNRFPFGAPINAQTDTQTDKRDWSSYPTHQRYRRRNENCTEAIVISRCARGRSSFMYFFTARRICKQCICITQYVLRPGVCPSVLPSAYLSHAAVLSKEPKLSSSNHLLGRSLDVQFLTRPTLVYRNVSLLSTNCGI